MQTIHNQGLRLGLGAFCTSPMQSVCIKANEPLLTLRWEKLSLQYTLKLQSSPNNPTHQKTNNSQFNHFHSSKPFGLQIKEAIQHINQNTNKDSKNLETNIQTILPFTLMSQKPYTEQEQQSPQITTNKSDYQILLLSIQLNYKQLKWHWTWSRTQRCVIP